MLKLSKEDGTIVVAFQDGLEGLKMQDVMHLESYLYKWKPKGAREEGASGYEGLGNWIDGTTFVDIVTTVRKQALRSEADIKDLALRVGDAFGEALRRNPKLTLGQHIDRVSRDAPLRLDEMSDDAVIVALTALAAPWERQ